MSPSPDDDFEDYDASAILARMYDEAEQLRYRTMGRLGDECRRKAKEEQQIVPYTTATFLSMNYALDVLRPDRQRDLALELIALLEDDGLARKIQPDFPEEEYERLKYQLSTCAYDNFAESLGALHGYNSEGLHACIADGLQVCRRTGKSECIPCFHGYATDVYMAADDLPMSLHFARGALREHEPSASEREWNSAFDESSIFELQGNLSASLEALVRAWRVRAEYHSPERAEVATREAMRRTLLLLGRGDELTAALPDIPGRAAIREYDPHEYPRHHAIVRRTDAIAASCGGDYATALAILEELDGLYRRQQCLSDWFENRLTWIANLMLAGRGNRVEALVEPLRAAARKARDFLTLRRLQRLLDPAVRPAPIAPADDLAEGPFADPRRRVSAATPEGASGPAPEQANETAEAATSAEGDEAETPPPLAEFTGGIVERLFAGDPAAEPDVPAIVEEMLGVPPDAVTDVRDALLLLRLLGLAGLQMTDEGTLRRIWNWALEVRRRHAQNSGVACQAAVLGSRLYEQLQSLEDASRDWLDVRELDEDFRRLLDGSPDVAPFWASAGMHFWSVGNEGEAERCFSRAFRLDRTFSAAAIKLSQLYNQGGRPRDALAALDLCLREGGDDPQLAWDAALLAFGLKNYEATLAYLVKLEQLSGETPPWSDYYRAFALLELDRPEEAEEAARREIERSPEASYAPRVIAAAARGRLDPSDAFREELAGFAAEPLRDVDYLTTSALVSQHRLLWLAAAQLPLTDAVRRDYERFLFSAGLAPDELFAEEREGGDGAPESVDFYRVTLRVVLDPQWSEQPYCRSGEEEWQAYRIHWGVLAESEDDAIRRAIAAQCRGAEYAVELAGCELASSGFTDSPGVVWQGIREEWTDTSDETFPV